MSILSGKGYSHMDSEEIIMQEYNSLRVEIQNAFTSSKTILSMGFGFVSALLSGGILVKDFPLIQSNSTHLFFALVILVQLKNIFHMM